MLVGKNNFRALEIFLSSFFFSFSISFSFRSKNKAERDAITATSQQTLRNKKKHFVEIFFLELRGANQGHFCVTLLPPLPPPSIRRAYFVGFSSFFLPFSLAFIFLYFFFFLCFTPRKLLVRFHCKIGG